MSDAHTKRASEIINQIMYITIASVSADGKPWNTPVYSGFDDNLNFYWFSDKNSQHSTNLRHSGNAFLVIYDSTVPESTGEGVYIQAGVQELTDEREVLSGLRVMDSRVGKIKDRKYEQFSGDAVLRVYKASPKKAWMNANDVGESGKYVRDMRVEVPIETLKKLVQS